MTSPENPVRPENTRERGHTSEDPVTASGKHWASPDLVDTSSWFEGYRWMISALTSGTYRTTVPKARSRGLLRGMGELEGELRIPKRVPKVRSKGLKGPVQGVFSGRPESIPGRRSQICKPRRRRSKAARQR